MKTTAAWSFDPATGCLRRGDEEVQLDPKEAAVLKHLAEEAPNPVSVEALLARSWVGVIVGDNAVHQVVARLRKVLGDSPRRPNYIQTLPKRGYRLLVPLGPSPAAEAHPEAERSHGTGTRRRVAAGLLVLLVVAAVAGALRPWAGRPGPEHRVVVSALAARSPDPRHVHLARDIEDEIVHALARNPALEVVASAPSPPQGQATALGLTGSLRPVADGMVRAALRLTHADRTIWSRNFDLPAGDTLRAPTEVATLVGETVSVAAAHLYRLRDATSSDGARLALLRARLLTGADVIEGARQALAYYEQALQLDPELAIAYALKALTYKTFANWFEMDTGDAVVEMRRLADQALARDPTLPMALILDADLKLFDLDFPGAEASLQRALAQESEPSIYAATLLAHCGRFDEALALVERAIQSNPVHPRHLEHYRGQFLWYARRHEEALAVLDGVLAVLPSDVRAQELRAYVLQSLGRHAEAVEALPAAFPHLYDWAPGAYAAGGLTAVGEGFLRLASNIERGRVPFVPPPSAWRMYVRGHAMLGEIEPAVRWMERGWSLGDRWEFFYNRVYPWPGYDALRAHPRFQALMNRTIGNAATCRGWTGSRAGSVHSDAGA